VVSALALSPTAFHAAASGPSAISAAARHAKAGTVVSYRDSQVATATFTVLEPLSGVRRGGRCGRAPKHVKSGSRRCRLLVSLGTFIHRDAAGANRLRFTGRIHGAKLRRGSYMLRVVARNAAGQSSAPVSKSFRLL
jgi:hypothetical protein